MADKFLAPGKIARLRSGVIDFVEKFLKYRKPELMVGKFLDSEGCQLGQFGIGGVSFLLALRNRHDVDGKALQFADEVIRNQLSRRGSVDAGEPHILFKDVPRIPTKTAPLTLSVERKSDFNSIFRELLFEGVVDDLVKPVADIEALEGDVFASCYVLQFLHFSGRSLPKVYQPRLAAMLKQVHQRLKSETYDIYQRLFISTTLSLFNYDQHRRVHLENLRELFAREQDWTRCFDDQTSFMDVWYSDKSSGVERHRFLRVPTFYVLLSSIYIQFGCEKDFFSFDPVKAIFSRMPDNYQAFAKEDRARAAVYYVFFAFVVLFPSTYFHVARRGLLARLSTKFYYFIGNLTLVGFLVSSILVLGLLCTSIFTVQLVLHVFGMVVFDSALSNLLGSVGVSVSAALGLMKTRKR